MNRKAIVWINMMVVLVVLVFAATLGMFIGSLWKTDLSVSDGRFVGSVVAKIDSSESYLNFAAQDAGVKVYNEMLKKGDYLAKPVSSVGGVPEFNEINSNWKSDFEFKFVVALIEELDKYGEQGELFSFMKNSIGSSSKLVWDGDKLVLFMKSGEVFKDSLENTKAKTEVPKDLKVETVETVETITVEIFPTWNVTIDFEKMGLESFEVLKDIRDICYRNGVEKEVLENCLNVEPKNFDVSVEEKMRASGENYFVVDLKSKRKFLIGDEVKIVGFSFALG